MSALSAPSQRECRNQATGRYLIVEVQPAPGWLPRDADDVPASFSGLAILTRRREYGRALAYVMAFNGAAMKDGNSTRWAIVIRADLFPGIGPVPPADQ
ncbi:MAG: hypothetical protein AB7O62_11445 [Pirellulales bacterium]